MALLSCSQRIAIKVLRLGAPVAPSRLLGKCPNRPALPRASNTLKEYIENQKGVCTMDSGIFQYSLTIP